MEELRNEKNEKALSLLRTVRRESREPYRDTSRLLLTYTSVVINTLSRALSSLQNNILVMYCTVREIILLLHASFLSEALYTFYSEHSLSSFFQSAYSTSTVTDTVRFCGTIPYRRVKFSEVFVEKIISTQLLQLRYGT